MRTIRSGSLSIALCLTLAIACSRVANQTNHIGAPCTTEADCETGLVCYQGQTCQEACLPGNACKDPTKTCMNGACVVGGGAGSLDGGDNGSEGGKETIGGDKKGDGKIVAEGWNDNELGGEPRFATDDAIIYYPLEKEDLLGAKVTELHWQAFAGGAKGLVLPPVAGGEDAFGGPCVANGYVYWTEPTASDERKLRRATSGNPPGAPEDVTFVGETDISIAGDQLLWVDTNQKMRIYNTKTSTLDPTLYGDSKGSPLGTVTGGKLYFLDHQNPNSVWMGTLGSPATKSNRQVPTTIGLVAVGFLGNELFGMTDKITAHLLAFDMDGAPSQFRDVTVLGENQSGGNQRPMNLMYFDGAYAFTRIWPPGSSTGEVVRIALSDGTKTHIGDYWAQSGERPVYATAGFVYVMEHVNELGRLAQWPKPQ